MVQIQHASKTVTGTYLLGSIQSVEIDADSLVRTCIVKCMLCNGDVTKKAVPKEVCVLLRGWVLIRGGAYIIASIIDEIHNIHV